MIIDIVFLLFIVLAVVRGYQRGLIVGLFSFVAVIIGLAAAMKLSAVVAHRIGDAVQISDRWLPVISFILVFIGVVLLIRLCANLIQKTVEVAMLGWANRLGGIILYAALYIIVYSIILFYAAQVHFIKQETLNNSVCYPFIQPWGPKVIDALGSIIPLFRDMFSELEAFFDGVAEKAG